MTGIPALHGTPPVAPARPSAAARHGGFALAGAAAAPASANPGAAPEAAPPAALAGLLALQEATPDGVRDRAARRHGRAMLAALAAWQRALLGGEDATAALERLSALLEAMLPAEDPALASVLGAVALRCRIELARRG